MESPIRFYKMHVVNQTRLLLLGILCLSSCIGKSDIDCSKIENREFISEFNVRVVNLNEDRLAKYISNEGEYFGEILELQTSQIGDTLVVEFYKFGGNAQIDCVEIIKSRSKIDIINYESNYLKEVTIREINYRILNTELLKLGDIEFLNSSRINQNN